MNKTVIKPTKLVVECKYGREINPTGKSHVEILLEETPGYKKPYVMIVIAQPSVSPMQYPRETFAFIQEVLKTYHISLDQVAVFLDFKNASVSNPAIMEWHFSVNSKGSYEDDKFSADITDLPDLLKFIRNTY